jgi:pimeloyl-ACP methyl ester carboxylesterase
MTEQFVDVGGLRTRYLEEGHGAPVVLLHGASLGSSADVWARNLVDLARRGFRAIAPDLPGFGLTDNPDDASLAFRTLFVPAFCDVLGIESAFLVGHSQSGRIAVALAAGQPERFPRIIVLGTASMLPKLPGAPRQADGEEGGEQEPTLADSRALLESNLFDKSLATPQAVALRHRMSTGKNFAAFIARKAAKGKGGATLADAKVPVRLIYGREDRSSVQRAALLHEADIHLVDRAGHLVQWDAPETFAALAAEFFAQ